MSGRHSAGALVGLVAGSVVLWLAVGSLCVLVGQDGVGMRAGEVMWGRVVDDVLPASALGAGLAVAGVVYQALLRNPLADPYLLGVASGATLGRLLWALPGVVVVPWAAALGEQACAFAGGMGAMALVFGLAARRGRLEPVTLLLTGVVTSALIGAGLLLLVALSRAVAGAALSIDLLLLGGIPTNLTRAQMVAAGTVIAVGVVAAQALSPGLSVARLSDGEARGLGLRLQRLRWAALGVASLMTAAAAAVAGPIGFVGLVCPHLARLVVGPDPRRTIAVSAALGASLLACADAASRLLSDQRLLGTHLPTGVLTALMGGPFFLVLLYRERRRTSPGGGAT